MLTTGFVLVNGDLVLVAARDKGDGLVRRYENWSEHDDSALVRAAASGEPEAYAELYRRHVPAVRTAVADYVRDPERQRDIVQDAFARALDKLDRLRCADCFRPWLLQIARNAAVDDLRARLAVCHEEFDPDDHMAESDDGPDCAVELRELASRIRLGVATLSTRDATALSLSVRLDSGPAEIAAVLGITHGNAKVVLHRARRRLRAAVSAAGAVP